ncbi:MAG TPA: efflux RND transporter periplasmic adaptor subunit [Clostridiales bacterium]|nr:efflux RND transporter periplasmic adaptor subunit [Clostridiales bacterium]
MCFKKRLISMISLALLIALLTGCELFPKEETLLAPPLMEPVAVSYSTVKAKRGDIVKTIRGSGNFVSIESKYMFFEARGGRLKDIYVRHGDVVKKGDLLAELYTDDLDYEIKMQELNLKKARLTYNQLKESNADKYTLQRAAIDVEIANMNLERLKKQKAETQLVSDMDGVVIYVDTRLSPGDNISVFQNIIRVADPEKLYLAYSGSNMTNFFMGAEVEVTIKDKQYKGKVISTPSSVPPDGDENLKNYVGIEVENLPEDVKMGDNAQITLILDESRDTIIVPKQAVRNYMGRKYVNVLENGLNNERDVEIGIETATEVEILEGVEEGEEIILR